MDSNAYYPDDLGPDPEDDEGAGARVWLPGDTVPEGTWVVDRVGGVYPVGPNYVVDADFVGALVQVHVPDHAGAVAAEQERRGRGPVRPVQAMTQEEEA